MLDKTRAQTFDGKDYPLRLGPCWHAVMTTYPRINPDNHNEKLHIPKDKSVSVLSRENETGQKEVKVLLGSDKIKFVPGTTSQPEVFVNGEKIVVSRNKAYQKVEENEIIFEIYKMGDRFIGLTSDKFDVSLALDGERVMLKVIMKFRNRLDSQIMNLKLVHRRLKIIATPFAVSAAISTTTRPTISWDPRTACSESPNTS